MNMEVQCAVRMRYFVNSVPGPFYYSEKFKAGLFPEKYEYTVIEGESITISFKSTVPVGCIASHKELMTHCDQNFYVFQPTKNQNFESCFNNIAMKDIIFKAQFCGITFGASDWQDEKTLEVYGISDGLYNSKFRAAYVRLSTSTVSTLNEMWQSVKIPDIKVTVIDKDITLANRLCQSHNDPHIRTFDGIHYDMMEVGEFVLYRNDNGPYWVHALFTNCGWTSASCNCGIAVRSRSSLFVIRTCAVVSRTKQELLKTPITKLISCNENDLLINYNQRRNEYTITLPTGTEINVHISWRFIRSVSIKPSSYDINEAKGLCGVPSITKDPSDDYTDRKKRPVSSSQEFAKSWRITSAMENEQLFVQEPGFINDELNVDLEKIPSNTNISTATTFCSCEDQASNTESLNDFNIIQCNLTESTEFCSSSLQSGNKIHSYSTSCKISKRKRRSGSHRSLSRRSTADTEDSDDMTDFEPVVYDEDLNSTDVISKTFRNGWTADIAYQTCQEALTTAIPSEVYSNFVEVDVENFIQSCVSDIEITGDTSFLTDTISAMATTILMEVSRNESLFIMNTTDGSQTLLRQITSKLCINNCSHNGICISGGCECSNGYIGDDCSKDVSQPPVNISLPSDGLCTTSTRACKKTNIYGDFLSTEIWYKIRYFKVVDNSKSYSSNWEVNKAEYRNMFMVTVELNVARKTRASSGNKMAEGYEITLSNDGTNFGDEVTILIYDDGCFSCNLSMTCVSLEVCESSIENQENNKDSNKTIIALALSFGVIGVVACLLALLFYLKHKNSDEKTKVGVYSGCQQDSGKDVDNGMLSNRTKTFRENTISDLNVYIEDGGEASIGNFGKQLPPQNHFKNNS
ncbi:von Willebrand factor D and EGF domain-containing protein-like isoform X2 [Mytilus californianus]|nr:von Willebrand factor D and EGF domain-containing protein-like isoform X2 [Mytilus californianus]